MKKNVSYKGQGRAFEPPASLNKRYRVRLVEAKQHREVNMSTLSSIGSVVDSADSASSLPPVEHHRAQEQVHYPSD